MKKKLVLMVLLAGVLGTFMGVSGAFAGGRAALEPKLDIDTVVLQSGQSKSVTADLSAPLDFEIVPVTLIGGDNNFTVSMSRTNTEGEVAFVWIQGFGTPTFDVNFGVTPITLRVSSEISDHVDHAFGLVIHGILLSSEEPPYEYSVSLGY